METFDINTSDEVVDGTEPGRTFQPLRYTTSVLDEIRVGTWLTLNTWIGTYLLAINEGLDVEAIQDPATSDAEAGELAADVVLSFPGVLRITSGPTIIREDGGKVVAIEMTADTIAGEISLTAPVP